mmetsp:Transcript_606/g.1610  ORF Transcript_606/g.1610 Transcript_606/m.1610 type:complete len:80 (+) Transcript_606:846-1085(+)
MSERDRISMGRVPKDRRPTKASCTASLDEVGALSKTSWHRWTSRRHCSVEIVGVLARGDLVEDVAPSLWCNDVVKFAAM